MKNKKKLKITIISLSIFLFVLIAGGIAAFYIAGDYIFTTLLESYVEEQIMNQFEENLNEIINTGDITQDDNKQELAQSETANREGQASGTPAEAPVEAPAAASNQPKPAAPKMTQEEIKKVVQEKTKQINEAIPTKDKLSISSLILNNLTQEDIRYLTSLMADGVSKQDLAEAKRIARARFTEEQLEEVYAYYKEYADVVLEK